MYKENVFTVVNTYMFLPILLVYEHYTCNCLCGLTKLCYTEEVNICDTFFRNGFCDYIILCHKEKLKMMNFQHLYKETQNLNAACMNYK